MWSDEKFDDYIDNCFSEMENKNTETQEKLGLGSFERFDFDTQNGLIIFSKSDAQLRIKVNLVCSTVQESNSFQWAWANKSLPEHMTKASERLQGLSKITGFDIFDTPTISAGENEGWEMSAVALREIGGLGVYRCPLGNAMLFLLLDSVVSDV
ncbi:DUF6882 domain-containing protein [Catenovulum sp. SX2]|uniref:DUF6882 domain-containing protein n=1 Tax=Catenovulum sp. SX2 TaxID=3398614 RepID=UPI003F8576F2